MTRLEEFLEFVQEEMTDFSQATEYHKKIDQLNLQLQTAKAKADEFKKAEALFGVEEVSDYSRLDDLIARFEPYRKVCLRILTCLRVSGKRRTLLFDREREEDMLRTWKKKRRRTTRVFSGEGTIEG